MELHNIQICFHLENSTIRLFQLWVKKIMFSLTELLERQKTLAILIFSEVKKGYPLDARSAMFNKRRSGVHNMASLAALIKGIEHTFDHDFVSEAST